jgi:predicted amidohydrolase
MMPLRLGLLAERPADAATLEGWLAAAAGQADLLVLPEGLPADEAALRNAARRHGVWLAGGSLPRAGGRAVPLLTPEGRCAWQEQHQPSATRWGANPAVFETPWGRLGISLGADLEFPKHARAQVEAGAWLLLSPAGAAADHASQRLRLSPRTRAMENRCFIALAPAAGEALVLGPLEAGFPADGILARGTVGWIFATLDPSRRAALLRPCDGPRQWPRAPVPMPQPAEFA